MTFRLIVMIPALCLLLVGCMVHVPKQGHANMALGDHPEKPMNKKYVTKLPDEINDSKLLNFE